MYSFDLIYVQAWSRPYIRSFDLIYVQVDLIYLTLDLIYQILTIYLKTDFCPIWRVIHFKCLFYRSLAKAFYETSTSRTKACKRLEAKGHSECKQRLFSVQPGVFVDYFSMENSHFQGVSSVFEMTILIQALFKDFKDLH